MRERADGAECLTRDTWTLLARDTWTRDTWTRDTWACDTWTCDTWTRDTWTHLELRHDQFIESDERRLLRLDRGRLGLSLNLGFGLGLREVGRVGGHAHGLGSGRLRLGIHLGMG